MTNTNKISSITVYNKKDREDTANVHYSMTYELVNGSLSECKYCIPEMWDDHLKFILRASKVIEKRDRKTGELTSTMYCR